MKTLSGCLMLLVAAIWISEGAARPFPFFGRGPYRDHPSPWGFHHGRPHFDFVRPLLDHSDRYYYRLVDAISKMFLDDGDRFTGRNDGHRDRDHPRQDAWDSHEKEDETEEVPEQSGSGFSDPDLYVPTTSSSGLFSLSEGASDPLFPVSRQGVDEHNLSDNNEHFDSKEWRDEKKGHVDSKDWQDDDEEDGKDAGSGSSDPDYDPTSSSSFSFQSEDSSDLDFPVSSQVSDGINLTDKEQFDSSDSDYEESEYPSSSDVFVPSQVEDTDSSSTSSSSSVSFDPSSVSSEPIVVF